MSLTWAISWPAGASRASAMSNISAKKSYRFPWEQGRRSFVNCTSPAKETDFVLFRPAGSCCCSACTSCEFDAIAGATHRPCFSVRNKLILFEQTALPFCSGTTSTHPPSGGLMRKVYGNRSQACSSPTGPWVWFDLDVWDQRSVTHDCVFEINVLDQTELVQTVEKRSLRGQKSWDPIRCVFQKISHTRVEFSVPDLKIVHKTTDVHEHFSTISYPTKNSQDYYCSFSRAEQNLSVCVL